MSLFFEGGCVAGLLVARVLAALRGLALGTPARSRILLLLGIALTVFTELVGVSPDIDSPYSGPGTLLSILLNVLGNSCLLTASFMLLGSALALLDDPGRSGYRKWSRLGANLAIVGFAISLLTEGLFVFLCGTLFLAQLSPSFPVAWSLVARLGLFVSVVLARRRAEEDNLRLRRQRRIVLLILVYLVADAASSICVALAPAASSEGGAWRSLWLTATQLTLLVLDSLLFRLCFRDPQIGYNSAAGLNSSNGAEA